MQGDLVKLEEILQSISNQERKEVIIKLISGLKKRGRLDYDKDYP